MGLCGPRIGMLLEAPAPPDTSPAAPGASSFPCERTPSPKGRDLCGPFSLSFRVYTAFRFSGGLLSVKQHGEDSSSAGSGGLLCFQNKIFYSHPERSPEEEDGCEGEEG